MTNTRRGMAVLLAVLGLGAAGAEAQDKRGLLICGDSMMKLVARTLTREMAAYPAVQADSVVSIGSGLARMDLFDWHAQLQKAAAAKPEAAVLLMGANDNQPMKTGTGVVQLNTAEWSAEYGRRVTGAIEILQAAGVKTIVWIGLPDMREATLQKDTTEINRILRAQLAGKSGVSFLDTTAMFSLTAGKFSPYIQKKDGMPLQVRNADGVHLNKDGADLLAVAVAKQLVEAMKLK